MPSGEHPVYVYASALTQGTCTSVKYSTERLRNMSVNKYNRRWFGTMLDCSRNAVMTVDSVKQWIDITADLGYNMLMLYEKLHKAFFDRNRNVYLTRLNDYERPLHAFTQALALYVGATPDDVKSKVVENMLSDCMIPCTLSASIYAYDVLLQAGDSYREYVRKDVEKVWGKMLYSGATTFWETDLGHADFHNAGSLCHGWSAVPIYLYGKYNLLEE